MYKVRNGVPRKLNCELKLVIIINFDTCRFDESLHKKTCTISGAELHFQDENGNLKSLLFMLFFCILLNRHIS